MSSYGDDLYSKKVVCDTIKIKKIIDVTDAEFKPPLSGGGVPTLNGVLNAGNDANFKNIVNVGGITMQTGNTLAEDGKITGATEVATNVLTTTTGNIILTKTNDIEMTPNAGTSFTGSVAPLSGNKTEFTNCDFSSSTNVFPTNIEDDTLSDVMGRGNSAGSNNLNMNGQNIENATSIGAFNVTANTKVVTDSVDFEARTGTTLKGSTAANDKTVCTNLDLTSATNVFPSSVDDDTLEDVLGRGNSAGTHNIDMNSQSITNANGVDCVGLGATVITSQTVNARAFQATAVAPQTQATINLNVSSATHTADLEFNGFTGAGQTTFIKGDNTQTGGVAVLTKCTHLDLSDTSNNIPGATAQDLASVLTTGNSAGSTDIDMNSNNIINGSTITTNTLNSTFEVKIDAQTGQLAGVNIRGIASTAAQDTFINGDSTTDANGVVKNTKCMNLDLSDTSNNFPTSLGSETLSQVLVNGNSAGSTDIDLNLNNITNGATITTSTLDSTNIVRVTAQTNSQATLQLKGVAGTGQPDTNIIGDNSLDANGNVKNTECVYLDLKSNTNVFPATLGQETLAQVLANGNSAGSTELDMNSQNIKDAAVITSTSITNTSVINSGTVIAKAVGVSTTNTALPAQVELVSGAIGTKAELLFTGFTGQTADTFILGDTSVGAGGTVKNTVCKNLDLRDPSNQLSLPTQETYEWVSVWDNAQTIFPPPPYADGSTTQIPTVDFVIFDFDQGNDKGWRYFAPQSDSDCQIDPDDHMELNEGEYIHAVDNNTAWQYAFYGVTAPTTIEAHASQVVEFTFNSGEYGYGRIYIALAYQPVGSTALPLILNNTFRLLHEAEGTAFATNPRLNGPITMKWYIPSTFPTDGTTWKIYPMIRTDDDETTKGRLKVVIGNGQPLDGCNPGDPPDFDPPNTNAQCNQLLIRGYPVPATFSEFANPSRNTPRGPGRGKDPPGGGEGKDGDPY